MAKVSREYVKVSQKHSFVKGYILFWGSYTEDDEERSYGGYTNDFNTCEKYSKEDLEKDYREHPYFEDMTSAEVLTFDQTFNIKISDLSKLANKRVIYEYK